MISFRIFKVKYRWWRTQRKDNHSEPETEHNSRTRAIASIFARHPGRDEFEISLPDKKDE